MIFFLEQKRAVCKNYHFNAFLQILIQPFFGIFKLDFKFLCLPAKMAVSIFWANVIRIKKMINLFVCIKLPFFIWFILLMDIIRIKTAPGDNESNFKKVSAIPCGCNTKWAFFEWYICWFIQNKTAYQMKYFLDTQYLYK